MKYFFTCFLCFIAGICFGQSGLRIDTSNYYNYTRDGGSFAWLRTSEAIPVIIEEIINAGFSNAFIEVGRLIKIDKSTTLVLQVSYSKDIRFGFIYENGHNATVSARDRDFLIDDYRDSYSQAEYTLSGDLKVNLIKQLPKNIFLLKESCYWHQFNELGGAFPVSKEIAIKILRQDIRAYLNILMATNKDFRN